MVTVRCDKCGKEFEVDSPEEASNFRCPCEKCDYESIPKTDEKTEHSTKNKEKVMNCADCSHKTQQ